MNNQHIQVIPAEHGVYPVYDMDEDGLEVMNSEPIIAWVIKIEEDLYGNIETVTKMITSEGDAAGNVVGVQNANMTISIFGDQDFHGISEANAYWLKERSKRNEN